MIGKSISWKELSGWIIRDMNDANSAKEHALQHENYSQAIKWQAIYNHLQHMHIQFEEKLSEVADTELSHDPT